MENSLERARELIKAKRYDEARRLLKAINHPTAKQWLETIDALSPASGGSSVARGDKRNDAADAAQARLARASELIKQRQYDEARRILEGMDHPKAREWLARLDTLPQPASATASSAVAAVVAPAPTFKLRKPLPDIEPKKPTSKAKFSGIALVSMGIAVLLIVVVAYIALKSGGFGQVLSVSTVNMWAPLLVMAVIVGGLAAALRGIFFTSRLGFRLLIVGGAIGAFAVTSFLNAQVRIPFQDESLSIQYPATWTAQSLNEDEDCLDDPAWRRCLLVLVNYTQGKRVWAVLKEDTLDEDTTLAEADDYSWSYAFKQSGTQLDKQWDTTISGQPASVRQYTFEDSSTDELVWYTVRFFAMRDPRHLIRLNFITEKPEAVNALWSEIEGMYKSIQFKEA